MASIATRPVIIGSLTLFRAKTPGAFLSTGLIVLVLIAGPPSNGLPIGSTILPISSSPTGISSIFPESLTLAPALTFTSLPIKTAPISFSPKLKAKADTLPPLSVSISIISLYPQLLNP